MSYTKGRWLVFTPEDYEGPGSLPGLGIESETGEAVVWYSDHPETGIQNDCDAPLLAASKELLKSTEWLFDAVDMLLAGAPVKDLDERMVYAEKAIEKARGGE